MESRGIKLAGTMILTLLALLLEVRVSRLTASSFPTLQIWFTFPLSLAFRFTVYRMWASGFRVCRGLVY